MKSDFKKKGSMKLRAYPLNEIYIIGKYLTNLIKKKGERPQINKIRNEKGITTDPTGTKKNKG